MERNYLGHSLINYQLKPAYLWTSNLRKPISILTQANVLAVSIDFNKHLRPKMEVKVKRKHWREGEKDRKNSLVWEVQKKNEPEKFIRSLPKRSFYSDFLAKSTNITRFRVILNRQRFGPLRWLRYLPKRTLLLSVLQTEIDPRESWMLDQCYITLLLSGTTLLEREYSCSWKFASSRHSEKSHQGTLMLLRTP